MKPELIHQDLSRFSLPQNFRGRSAVVVQLWWAVQTLLFHTSPQFAYGLRRWLLRMFGARIGKQVLIRPSASITYPWKLKIGDFAWIGDDVTLYSLGNISIGDHAVVSQGTYVCAADHDHALSDFPIRDRPIVISNEVWIAAQCFIGPGVHIGKGAVVGARSAVFENLPPAMICLGSPARPIKKRKAKSSENTFTQY